MGSGEEKELGQEERLGRPGREKKEGVGLGPVVGFWAGFSSFPFWAEVGLGLGCCWVFFSFYLGFSLFYF